MKTHPKLLRTQCLEKGENEREENIKRRAYLAATLTVHWTEQDRYSKKNVFIFILPLIHGGARSGGLVVRNRFHFIVFILIQRIFIINLYFRVEGVHNFSFLIINLFSATLGFLEICWRLVNGHEHEMFETKLFK